MMMPTDELLRAFIYFFLLGFCSRFFYEIIIFLFSVVKCFISNVKRKNLRVKVSEICESLINCKLSDTLIATLLIFWVLLVGILFAILNYAIVDGVIRLITVFALIIGIVVSFLLIKGFFDLSHEIIYKTIAIILFLPINKLLEIDIVIIKKLKKIFEFVFNKAKSIYIDNIIKK